MKAEAMSGRGEEWSKLPVLWTSRHSTQLPSAGLQTAVKAAEGKV